MKRSVILILLILCCSTAGICQKENNNWTFGWHAGLDFNTVPPAPFVSAMGNTIGPASIPPGIEGQATVSGRTDGRLLFYSDGYNVWNRNHQVMPNGNGVANMVPNSWSTTQGAVIVPDLSDTNRFFLFSLGDITTPYRILSYSVVDMTLQGGLGDVVTGQKNIHLDSQLAEKMISVGGTDCNVWVIVQSRFTNTFKAYEVTSAGVNRVPVVSNVAVVYSNNGYAPIGILNATRDGKRIVSSYFDAPIFNPGRPVAELYDFDGATGVLSNPIGVTISDSMNKRSVGVGFSPDGSKLYLTDYPNGWPLNNPESRLIQYDLTNYSAAAIMASRAVIASVPNSLGCHVAMGPDNKGYVSFMKFINPNNRGGGYLHCIEYPDRQGSLCGFSSTPVALLPAVDSASSGLPNWVVYPIRDTVVQATTLCAPLDFMELKSGLASAAYYWNDGTTDTACRITGAGTYWVRAVSVCQVRIDTFNVIPNPDKADLGPDREVCEGTPVVLAPAGSFVHPQYRWSTGDTTSSIAVTSSGSYTVRVSVNGCASEDTIEVNVLPSPVVDLGRDTGVCDHDIPFLLENRVAQPGASWLWSTGVNTASLSVTRTDTYWLEADIGGCKGSDTVFVEIVPAPFVNIGNDSTICEQFPLRVGAEVYGADYSWNTGASDPYISVNSSGTYILEVNLSGCRVYDTINIVAMPVPDIDLGADDDICPEQTIVLDATYQPGSRYLWNTGDTSSTYEAVAAGVYQVTVTSTDGCVGADEIVLSFYPDPVVLLGADTVVCEETPLYLSASLLNVDSLLWSDGTTGQTAIFSHGGIYTATGFNRCGSVTDTIEVRQIFCDIWLPNAFTPNGDGMNDVFRVLGNIGRMEGVGLSVYNRWGQRIFHTQDKYAGWDGFYNGVAAQLGTYVYVLQYNIDGRPYQQQGNFHLLR